MRPPGSSNPSTKCRPPFSWSRGRSEQRAGRGPIQAAELLQASGWQDLLRSYAIADPVVIGLGLFVTPAVVADSVLFRTFRVDQSRLRPGDYKLTIAGERYVLNLQPGVEVEKGVVGDSIGRPVGFQWQPVAGQFGRRTEVVFNVQTPEKRHARSSRSSPCRCRMDRRSCFCA